MAWGEFYSHCEHEENWIVVRQPSQLNQSCYLLCKDQAFKSSAVGKGASGHYTSVRRKTSSAPPLTVQRKNLELCRASGGALRVNGAS